VTGGLVVIGIPDAAALTAALTYRMVTFYLPPIGGWFAMRTLRQEEYLEAPRRGAPSLVST
jgi:uncharacterized membrane protein YbhN (UPF0104 family)